MDENGAPLGLTVAQTARILHVQENTIRQWMHRDRIEVLRTQGGRPRIPLPAVELILEQRRQEAEAERAASDLVHTASHGCT